MMKDTKEKLSGLTVGLHWLVGLTIIDYKHSCNAYFGDVLFRGWWLWFWHF